MPGRIMVLFVFVIMLLNFRDEHTLFERVTWKKNVAAGLGLAVMMEMIYIIMTAAYPSAHYFFKIGIHRNDRKFRRAVVYEIPASVRGNLAAFNGGNCRCNSAGKKENGLREAMIPLQYYLIVSAVMFVIGAVGL